MKGILGKKMGMTQVFDTNGKLIPVTVIYVEPNVVTQIRTMETDGYEAIQLATDTVRDKVSNKAKAGHTKKANTAPKRFLKEIRGVNISEYNLGDLLKADKFEVGEFVDVTGISKGKGFEGVIKRFNQTRGPMGHGSQYHRGVGSLGTMLPKRVLPGKKLPGHMGNVQVTIQNLEVIAVDLENNCILIKGNVPGPKYSMVIVKTAAKKPNQKTNGTELISYVEIPVQENETATEEVVEEVAEATEETNEEVTEEAPEAEETQEESVNE